MSQPNPALRAADPQVILDEVRKTESQIRERAYALFESHGTNDGDLDNWLAAEAELIWRPTIEIRERGNQLTVQVAAPGLSPDDFRIEVTPTDLLIATDGAGSSDRDGTDIVHLSELQGGRLFRVLRLPRKIAPKTMKAQCRNGMLMLTATIATGEEEKTQAATA